MVSMKPTAQDAVDYLSRVCPDRVWTHNDGIIYDQIGDNYPAVFAHEEELHWMSGKRVGARGICLWIFEEKK
jgi:hypothetical protein